MVLMIAFIGVFFNGCSMVLRSKGLRPMPWRSGIDIPRAKKELFVFGWLQMVLTVICIGVNCLQIGIGVINTILSIITIVSSVKIITMSSGSMMIPNGLFGILFGMQVAVYGIGHIANRF